MKPRAIMVSVDYSDLLSITLPYNRHHFDQVCVVTSLADFESVSAVIQGQHVTVMATDLFYADGADFNKWRALEWALDIYGRHGLLAIMDADVLWPKEIPAMEYEPGKLYSPLRHMLTDLQQPLPPESEWSRYPIHRNVAEWAGYTQIFYADDPHLGPTPWHQIDWRHAGGADSYFQMKWPVDCKVRTRWNVLHLGTAGANWCGRATPYLDGTLPAGAGSRSAEAFRYRANRPRGVPVDVRHAHEKLRLAPS